MTDISDVRKSSLILSAFSAKTNSAESEPQLNTKTKIKRMKQKSKIEVWGLRINRKSAQSILSRKISRAPLPFNLFRTVLAYLFSRKTDLPWYMISRSEHPSIRSVEGGGIGADQKVDWRPVQWRRRQRQFVQARRSRKYCALWASPLYLITCGLRFASRLPCSSIRGIIMCKL